MEHDEFGKKWTGLTGYGFSMVAKVLNIADLVEVVRESVENLNANFTIVPCKISNKVMINAVYPKCLEDAKLEITLKPKKGKGS